MKSLLTVRAQDGTMQAFDNHRQVAAFLAPKTTFPAWMITNDGESEQRALAAALKEKVQKVGDTVAVDDYQVAFLPKADAGNGNGEGKAKRGRKPKNTVPEQPAEDDTEASDLT